MIAILHECEDDKGDTIPHLGTPGYWKAMVVSGPRYLGNLSFEYPFPCNTLLSDEIQFEQDYGSKELVASTLLNLLQGAGILSGFTIDFYELYDGQRHYYAKIVDGEFSDT